MNGMKNRENVFTFKITGFKQGTANSDNLEQNTLNRQPCVN